MLPEMLELMFKNITGMTLQPNWLTLPEFLTDYVTLLMVKSYYYMLVLKILLDVIWLWINGINYLKFSSKRIIWPSLIWLIKDLPLEIFIKMLKLLDYLLKKIFLYWLVNLMPKIWDYMDKESDVYLSYLTTK